MFDDFLQFIHSFVSISETEVKAIRGVVQESRMQKKDHFILAGEICHQLLFFTNGYFRFYHYKTDGTEITSDFYFPPNFITSYTSFVTGKPSEVYVQAMEDMDVLVIHRSDLYHLYTTYPSFEKLGRLMAEQVAITSEKHLFSLLNLTAEERYKRLLDDYPQFIQQIPLQYIASYLGIKQETLSRVRKRIV